MDWTEIEKLIAAYYEGQTTLEEEEIIKHAMLREDVPQHLAHEKQLFTFFDVAAEESIGAAQEISITPKLKLWPKLAGVAAVALLLVTLTLRSDPTVYGEINNQKIYDKEVAYDEAMKGLLLVSEKMNSGTKHLQYLNYLTEEK